MVRVGLAVLALAATWFLVDVIRRLALKHDVMDVPNERSSHVRPTPRGGGLAIVAVTVCGALLVGGVQDWFGKPAVFFAYLAGATATAAVSWFDDLRGLSNRVRFSVHVLSAVMLLAACGSLDHVVVPGIGEVSIPYAIALPMTLVWIVGLTNAYNFMDGIDGIAGGQAVVAGAGWIVLTAIGGSEPDGTLVSTLGLLIAASSLGFLLHNWPPAAIFMGDVGSAFLGYSFAALVVIAGTEHPQWVLPGVFFVWPFVFDTTLTLVRRARARENIFAAHRSHLYQRLNIAGYSHRWVTILYVQLALLGVAMALLAGQGTSAGTAVAMVVLGAVAVSLFLFVQAKQRQFQTQEDAP